MRRACGFGRLLLLSALLVALTLPAGIAGAGAATAATSALSAPNQDETWTCQSPNCPITINDNASALQDQAATPYPSEIRIGRPDCCTIDKVTVTLTGLTHSSIEDVDVLLVREFGTQVDVVELMSDVGSRIVPAAGLTLTFDDAASASLPRGVPVTSGTYKPTNYSGALTPCVIDNPPTSANTDPFPAPAPAPPAGGYFETLSVLHGRSINGTWRLYVGDDCLGGSGSITSWSLSFTRLDCNYLCLIKRADAVRVAAGSPIGFTIDAYWDFHWPFPEDEIEASLDDPLPAGTGVNWSITSGPGGCSITGAVGSQRLSCGWIFRPGEGEQIHVSSPTSAQSCGTYPNTATGSGVHTQSGEQFVVSDTHSITVTGCPTAVTLASFAATRSKRGVLVRWRTASEAGTLGFNLYRERAGWRLRVSSSLIPSVFGGSTTGHGYSWLDRSAPRGGGALKYRLQTVGLDGTRRWVGAASIAR